MKAHELLTDETKWTQGAFARTAKGKVIGPDCKAATRFCISGALIHCYGEGYFQKWLTVSREVYTKNPALWNDRKSRTFAEVRALLLKLDI